MNASFKGGFSNSIKGQCMQPTVVTVNSVMNLLVSLNSIKQQIIGCQPDTVYCTLNIFNTCHAV